MFKLEGHGLSRVQDFKGHEDQVEALAWNPAAESQFVSISQDKTIRVWDVKAGKAERTVKTKEENLNLAFNPTGTVIGVSNVKEELAFYDMRMWKVLRHVQFNNEVNDLTWDKTPDGNLLFVADSSGSISVMNGVTFSSTPIAVLSYHMAPCNAVAVDPCQN